MARVCGVLLGAALFTGCTQGAPADRTAGGPLAAPSATEIVVPLNFRTHLNGASEVPVRETRAQGQAIFKLERDGDEMSYKLIASNIDNVFQAHIHMGPATGTGPIVVWLYPSTSPVPGPPGAGRHDGVLAEGTITAGNLVNVLAGRPLSDLVSAIRSGNAYVNVHTNDGVAPTNTGPGDFPGGEIRGQL